VDWPASCDAGLARRLLSIFPATSARGRTPPPQRLGFFADWICSTKASTSRDRHREAVSFAGPRRARSCSCKQLGPRPAPSGPGKELPQVLDFHRPGPSPLPPRTSATRALAWRQRDQLRTADRKPGFPSSPRCSLKLDSRLHGAGAFKFF